MTTFDSTLRTRGTRAILALADGTLFEGIGFGALKGRDAPTVGEVVFNTSMYGYQEILTDPSYAGQILCYTYPHIGNVGCNNADLDGAHMFAEGAIIRNQTKCTSNFRATMSLEEFLVQQGKMGISGIDTRALVRHLRDHGAQMGALAAGEGISPSELVDRARAMGSMAGKDYVQQVSCKTPYTWNQCPWSLECSQSPHATNELEKLGYRSLTKEEERVRPHVVALDCGIKYSILRLLVGTGFRVTVVPATSTAKEILEKKPDALFLSNGPGDPATLGYIVSAVKDLLGKVPLFGICLGHQILGQVVGGKTYKLKFGHRGGNHPVLDSTTGKVEITVQNHGFAVDPDSLPKNRGISVSHINLNDGTVEGLEVPEYNAFSVQYHPEASPGPHDSRYLFQRFFERVQR